MQENQELSAVLESPRGLATARECACAHGQAHSGLTGAGGPRFDSPVAAFSAGAARRCAARPLSPWQPPSVYRLRFAFPQCVAQLAAWQHMLGLIQALVLAQEHLPEVKIFTTGAGTVA